MWGGLHEMPAGLDQFVAGWLHEYLGRLPLFNTSLAGPRMLPAALVLATMISPTLSAVSCGV